MLDELIIDSDLENNDEERDVGLIKESHSSRIPGDISSSFHSRFLEEGEAKGLIYKGAKYVASKNLAFLCKIIQCLSNLSSTILFVPKADHLLVCTHNTSTSMFSRTIFRKEFFAEVDSTCLVDRGSGCCISSESAVNVFKMPPELLEDIKYLTIDADPNRDFIDVMLFGPGMVSELIRVNQLSFSNPIDDYTSDGENGGFRIVSHVDLWDSLFKRSTKSLSEVVLHMKADCINVTLRKQEFGTKSNFSIEIKAKNLVQYNADGEIFLTFSYSEFALACSIVSRINKVFVLEYVDGEAPLKMSLHQHGIVDFEIFFPCQIEYEM